MEDHNETENEEQVSGRSIPISNIVDRPWDGGPMTYKEFCLLKRDLHKQCKSYGWGPEIYERCAFASLVSDIAEIQMIIGSDPYLAECGKLLQAQVNYILQEGLPALLKSEGTKALNSEQTRIMSFYALNEKIAMLMNADEDGLGGRVKWSRYGFRLSSSETAHFLECANEFYIDDCSALFVCGICSYFAWHIARLQDRNLMLPLFDVSAVLRLSPADIACMDCEKMVCLFWGSRIL